MSLFPYQYPEDLTGVAVRNRVTNEVRTFASHPERIFIPTGGPYFTDSLRVINTNTGLELEPLTQYTCLHMHTEGTLASGAQVCTIILIKDVTVLSVTLEYQVIGGQYGEVVTTIKDIVSDANLEHFEKVSWGSQIYGKPEVYPAAVHRHPGGEFGDWKRFHMALNNIYQAIIHKDNGAWQAVYAYMSRSVNKAIENHQLDNDQYYRKSEINQLLNQITAPTLLSAALGNQLALKPDGLYYSNRVNVKTVTTSYTPTTTELLSNLLLRVDSSASPTIVTIPKVATDTPIGTVVHIRQINEVVTIQAATGVTISPSDSLDLRRAGITATLVYVGSETWDLITELD